VERAISKRALLGIATMWVATIFSMNAHAQSMEAWAQRYSNGVDSTNQASKVITDSSGNVIIAGSTDERRAGLDMLVIKYSSTGVPLWTNRYNGPGNRDDVAQALAVDGGGNVFVTGYSYASNTTNSADFATIAYSSLGTPLWTNRYNGPGNDTDVATAIATDTSGNVFVTGFSWSGTSFDFATIKYANSGLPLWTNRFDGAAHFGDFPRAIAADGSGNVFVTGFSYNNPASDCDFATIAYSNSGVPLWTNIDDGPGMLIDQPQAIAVDFGGNILVAGYSYNGSNYDYMTIKYSGAGLPLWVNFYDGPGTNFDAATALAVDGNGNAFVTGYSWSGNSYDFATVKYSSAGLALWTNRYNGSANGTDQPSGIALDTAGNVFVSGISPGSGSSSDFATIKYSNSGTPIWTNRYNGPGNSIDEARAITVSGSGNVFVTGPSCGLGGSRDCATIAYSNSGAPLWTNRFNSPGNRDDSAFAVGRDAAGNIFVTGGSSGLGTMNDFATTKYSSNGVALWTNRYNGPASNDDIAYSLALDFNGNVFVTGSSYGSNGLNADFATIAYSNSGMPLWTNRYNGPANGSDFARAIATDANGNIFVSGYSAGGGSGHDFATLKY